MPGAIYLQADGSAPICRAIQIDIGPFAKMVAITPDLVPIDHARSTAVARKLLLILMMLGLLSLASSAERIERDRCGPFTLGVSALGGCDYLE